MIFKVKTFVVGLIEMIKVSIWYANLGIIYMGSYVKKSVNFISKYKKTSAYESGLTQRIYPCKLQKTIQAKKS